MSQNRLLAILLSVLAVLVLVVGGLSAFLLLSGSGDGGESGGGGTTTQAGGGGGLDRPTSGRIRLPGSDPLTLDPHIAGDATSAEYIVEIFGGLVTLDQNAELALDLAASFEISDDGLTYTFTLRDDIEFHSGDPVTAEDVKYSMERATSRELAAATGRALGLTYLGDIVGAREHFFGVAEDLEGVTVIDDRTVEIRLREHVPPDLFLAKLTYPTAFVVDREQVEQSRNWTRRPNGTGPYRLVEWNFGERLVLEANRDYHLGAPKLEQAVYLLSGGSALTRWENDELDVAFVGLDDLERALDPTSNLGPHYSAWPQFSISYLAFNTQAPPFDDVHVRRALAMSIDRQRIVDVTLRGATQRATGILMPNLPGYTPEDRTLPFDPDAARAELAMSRYADAMPPIEIAEVSAGAEASLDMTAFLDQWERELGVSITVQQNDFASILAARDAGELQAFTAGWIMDYPDPQDVLDILFHSESTLNDMGYSNPEADALIEAARVEQDRERRFAIYRELEALLLQDAVWIPLYFSTSHIVVKPEISGWFEPPMVIPRLRYVEVNR